jgi:DNA-binding MarR family transcriptional regulator
LPEPKTAGVLVTGCTCARLRRLTRRVTAVYDRLMEPAGMTVTQFSLLSQLRRLDGLPLTRLAEALDMDRSSLTRTLRPMVEAGWVRLDADAHDARARCVRLTDLGLAERERLHPLWLSAQGQVNTLLGQADTAQLHDWIDHHLPLLRSAEESPDVPPR